MAAPTLAGWMSRHPGLLAAVAAVVVGAAFAVGVLRANDPGAGISRDEAIQRAWAHADPGAVAVVTAEVKRDFRTGFDLPTHHWTWVVTFSGQWHLLCQGGSPAECNPTSEWVAIDYYTGEWIASQHSYPSR